MCRIFIIYHDTVSIIRINCIENIEKTYCVTKCIEQLWLHSESYWAMSQVRFSSNKFAFSYYTKIPAILKEKIHNIKKEKEYIDFSLRENYALMEYKKENIIYSNYIPLDSTMMLLKNIISCK